MVAVVEPWWQARTWQLVETSWGYRVRRLATDVDVAVALVVFVSAGYTWVRSPC